MEQLFGRKETARLLGISIATLDEARNGGKISYIQYVPNGCVFFTESAIREFMARCTHRARPENTTIQTYRKPRQTCES